MIKLERNVKILRENVRGDNLRVEGLFLDKRWFGSIQEAVERIDSFKKKCHPFDKYVLTFSRLYSQEIAYLKERFSSRKIDYSVSFCSPINPQ
jgi:hypothetical protein